MAVLSPFRPSWIWSGHFISERLRWRGPSSNSSFNCLEMSKWSIEAPSQSRIPFITWENGSAKLTHYSRIRALCDILIGTLFSGIRLVFPVAQIHQVQAIPLMDSKFLSQLVCDVTHDVVEI